MTQEIDYLNRTKVASLRQKGYRIVGFGAGLFGLKTINYLDNPFDYFVDNSKDKTAKGWKEYTDEEVNVPIHHFDYLYEEKLEEIVVVLCSEHYEAMSEQLLKAFPNVNVLYSPLLKDFTTFSRLLKCSNKILVSAYGGAGGLYLLNGETGNYSLIKSGSFRGVTTYQGSIVIANENGDLFQINSFDPLTLRCLLEQPERTNTHGILYWEELDKLFVTETLNDCISVYQMEPFEKVDEIPLSYKSQFKGRNYHHVNDICLFNGKIYLSVISQTGNFYNDFLDGVIFELDYKNGKTLLPVVENLLFPHAILNVEGKLNFLNSFNGDVLNIAKDQVINLPGFIRGMDANDGLLYIGQSRHRRLDKAKLYFNGVSMDSGIYVVDPESSMYRFLHLPEMCDVFNVKVLQ